MKREILIFGAMFGFLFSCNSDDGNNCPEDFTGELTESEEKLVGEWRLSAITSDEEIDLTDDDEENPSTDLYAQYSDCQKDAGYVFNNDRSYTFEQGQNGADCNNKAILEGSWQLTDSSLSLVGTCSLQDTDIDFNEDDSVFTLSGTFNVTDVEGKIVQAELSFSYTKTP